jgi:hypothetical protein
MMFQFSSQEPITDTKQGSFEHAKDFGEDWSCRAQRGRKALNLRFAGLTEGSPFSDAMVLRAGVAALSLPVFVMIPVFPNFAGEAEEVRKSVGGNPLPV